jgi:blocked-early-in-transport protein 1
MGSGSAVGSAGNGSGYTRNAMMVEGQNDDLLEGLLGKVKILKDITVGIGDEVRASNMELGGMVSGLCFEYVL